MKNPMNLKVSTVLVVSCLIAARLAAQWLGDVAKKEEARRKAIAKPAKVYTNDSLKAEPAPTPAVPPASGQAPDAQAAPSSPSQAQAQPGQPGQAATPPA